MAEPANPPICDGNPGGVGRLLAVHEVAIMQPTTTGGWICPVCGATLHETVTDEEPS